MKLKLSLTELYTQRERGAQPDQTSTDWKPMQAMCQTKAQRTIEAPIPGDHEHPVKGR